MHVIVIGCGRVGATLATILSREGHNVVVIDNNPASFKRLGDVFNGLTINGVGFDRDILIEAGIEKADAVATVTNGDNTNIMAAEIAKAIFNVPRVVARVYDPQRQELYWQLGIDTICGTTLVASLFRNRLLKNGLLVVGEAGCQAIVVEVAAAPKIVGKTVGELEEDWLRIISLRRGCAMLWAERLLTVDADDILTVVAQAENLPRLRHHFGLEEE